MPGRFTEETPGAVFMGGNTFGNMRIAKDLVGNRLGTRAVLGLGRSRPAGSVGVS
ncbi:Uncharacterised protein [Mycobacterium tuberculosis]|nr:Uncharacterised protein [Mycobacterium tuberculosis]